MKIFLSHSSRQKPVVREIRKGFPSHVSSWLDEERLLIGDDLSNSLESVIMTDADYVLLFLDESAAKSKWVAKEVAWALEAERTIGRSFLLPIVIDPGAFESMGAAMSSRKYLQLKDFTEAATRELSEQISSELFALICRDLQRSHMPKPLTAKKALSDAELILSTAASLIRKAVFPHRKQNAIQLETLRAVVNSQTTEQINPTDFEDLLAAIVQRNLVPGLSYDGFELYLVEEHARWKSELNHDKKVRVARKAAAYIQNGMSVFLDAGSTTEEIVKVLCRKIETRAITKISVATTSINHADLISDCCVAMGFDDEFSAVRLFVPGGQVRPGTQAVIPLPSDQRQLSKIAEHLGGFDLGLVGVNGVSNVGEFTTHENSEALNKIDILRESRTRIVVCDSSKVGIALERRFAELGDDLKLIVDEDSGNKSLVELHKSFSEKIVFA